jgi:hypothetical protein
MVASKISWTIFLCLNLGHKKQSLLFIHLFFPFFKGHIKDRDEGSSLLYPYGLSRNSDFPLVYLICPSTQLECSSAQEDFISNESYDKYCSHDFISMTRADYH